MAAYEELPSKGTNVLNTVAEACCDVNQTVVFGNDEFLITGKVNQQYRGVYVNFLNNYKKGLEENSQLVIYKDGVVLIDVCGSKQSSTTEKGQTYNRESIQNIFSMGKNVEVVAMALVVQSGTCQFHDKVSAHWKKYCIKKDGDGKDIMDNVKEKMNVANIMRHDGGCPWFITKGSNSAAVQYRALTLFDLTNDKAKCRTFVEENPIIERNGCQRVYHLFTRSIILDGLLHNIAQNRKAKNLTSCPDSIQSVMEPLLKNLGAANFHFAIPTGDQDKYSIAIYDSAVFNNKVKSELCKSTNTTTLDAINFPSHGGTDALRIPTINGTKQFAVANMPKQIATSNCSALCLSSAESMAQIMRLLAEGAPECPNRYSFFENEQLATSVPSDSKAAAEEIKSSDIASPATTKLAGGLDLMKPMESRNIFFENELPTSESSLPRDSKEAAEEEIKSFDISSPATTKSAEDYDLMKSTEPLTLTLTTDTMQKIFGGADEKEEGLALNCKLTFTRGGLCKLFSIKNSNDIFKGFYGWGGYGHSLCMVDPVDKVTIVYTITKKSSATLVSPKNCPRVIAIMGAYHKAKALASL